MEDFDIVEEADGKKSKVYPKIAKLTNLGRTYFVNTSEIVKKNKEAQTNMVQKYGADIYGGDGKDGLISCKVSEFVKVPGKFKESFGFGKSSDKDEFEKFVDDL